MKAAWLIVREEKHIDPKYWVCFDREDALIIAEAVTQYWLAQYELESFDAQCSEEQIYSCVSGDGAFSLTVTPITIREKGEHKQIAHQ